MHYKPHAANLWLAAAAFGFLLAAHLGLQTFAPVLTSKQLADAIAPDLKPDDIIVIHGEYEAGSTLGFYLKRNDLHIFEGRSSNLWYGSFFPDAPQIFEDEASLRLKWSGIAARLPLAGRQPAAAKAPRQELTFCCRAEAKRSSATSRTLTDSQHAYRKHRESKKRCGPKAALSFETNLRPQSYQRPHARLM